MKADRSATRVLYPDLGRSPEGRSTGALSPSFGVATASGAAAAAVRQKRTQGSAFCAVAPCSLQRHAPETTPFGAVQDFAESVQRDLEMFWVWCPTPEDGLHRCGLLVKLFDYCGLTRAESKVACRLRRLDAELRSLAVFATDMTEPHQRVAYDAFVLNRRLREAIVRCGSARLAWARGPHDLNGQAPSPLAAWVLTIIMSVGSGTTDS